MIVGTAFERVVCGIDRSVAGVAAAVLAARLIPPQGKLWPVSLDDPSRVGVRLERLLAEIERRDATLVAVGSDGLSRAVGIARGSASTHLVHEAPCSVLVARAPRSAELWPRSIVVGVDGSRESEAALAVARELSGRFGAELRAIVATGDARVDPEAARRVAPELEELPGRAVDELHVLSESADLVVVGSRNLTGVRALASVSERVAHEARSPVLVVRDTAIPRRGAAARSSGTAMRSSPQRLAGSARMPAGTSPATLAT